VPRYFFDIEDDQLSFVDTEGSELADLDAAKREAITTASSIAKDLFTVGASESVVITLRQGSTIIFKASVRLSLAETPDFQNCI
jgi:hypothetical protein